MLKVTDFDASATPVIIHSIVPPRIQRVGKPMRKIVPAVARIL
jgi:hypothetical protein